MNPIDSLTQEDKDTIFQYIRIFTDVAEPAPFEQVFRVWNENKRTLYKALGHKLRQEYTISIPKNYTNVMRELCNLYDTYPIYDTHDMDYIKKYPEKVKEHVHNDFIFNFLTFLADQPFNPADFMQAQVLVKHSVLSSEHLRAEIEEYHFQNWKCTMKGGMRVMRTLQKLLKAMHFPRMDSFYKWRDRIATINSNREIKSKLVISIHPLDFMTMSDNACNWTSCMSWKSGSYNYGTLEMMNSNMVAIAYLKNDSPFEFSEGYFADNKSWRQLVYVHKYILMGGRCYPYTNDKLEQVVLEKMRQLVKENLNWDYQFINQMYQDNNNIKENHFLRDEHLALFSRGKEKKKPKKAIYLYTDAMYNDLIGYNSGSYMCCRNTPKKTLKLCVSGRATCLCCGNYISDKYDYANYEDMGDKKVCGECEDKICLICDKIHYHNYKESIKDGYTWVTACSKEHFDKIYYSPYLRRYINIEEFDDKRNKKCYIFKEDFPSSAWNKLSWSLPEESYLRAHAIKVLIGLNPIRLRDISWRDKIFQGGNNEFIFVKVTPQFSVQAITQLIWKENRQYSYIIPVKEKLNETSSSISS